MTGAITSKFNRIERWNSHASIISRLWLSFAKTRSALKTLTFLTRDGSLNIHDGRPLLSDCLSQIRVQGSTRIGPRKLGAATTACHSDSNSSHPTPAKYGSAVLGLALPNVEELAGIVDHRKAGYSGPMASERVFPMLDAAVETKAHRLSGNRERDQGFNPEDCPSESALGKSTSTR